MVDRATIAAARDDLDVFAALVGRELTPWQVAALKLEKRTTCIVAPRQSGKSRSLAVLALHHAFRAGGKRVLVVSAGEEASKRLLADVRVIATSSALLRGSVVDETVGLITLTNGSEIRSVPASERQIRGWTADLLIIDEAALVPDAIIVGAALPTTAARPDARIVMASSATTATGAFFDHVALGRQGSEHVEAIAWALADAWWISPSVIAAARESMTDARFNAEYMGVFASGADALFPRALLDRVTADLVMPGLYGLGVNAGMAGVDWGATTDRSALCAVSRLESPAGVFAVTCAHAWPSGEPLDGPGGVIGQIADLPAAFELVSMETNGLGFPLAHSLARRLRGRKLQPELAFVHTTGDLKSATYGALRMLLEQGRLVLPASATGLLRELLLLRVAMTQQGGERIEAGVGHDDLADALMLALGPYQDSRGQWRSRVGDAAEHAGSPASVEESGRTVRTGGGLVLPRVPVLARVGRPGGGASVQSRLPRFGEPVIQGGGLTLVGERYLDVVDGGRRVPPAGFEFVNGSGR